MKSVDRADMYLSYYSVLRKTVKWSEKVYLLNFALFNAFFVYRTVNSTYKYQNFLHEVGRSWISQVQNTTKSNSDDLQLPER
jgi:hypothetical protein